MEGWDANFEGEITGLIGAGLFIKFGDVFEGFLPSRTLADDRYEPTPLGTALVGRRSGHRFRIGDRIPVRVTGIRRAEGKVELALAGAGRGGRAETAPGIARSTAGRPGQRPVNSGSGQNRAARRRKRA